MKYLIVIEATETGYSAYLPDLLGCVSTESTRDEIERTMRAANEFHMEGLKAWRDRDSPAPDHLCLCWSCSLIGQVKRSVAVSVTQGWIEECIRQNRPWE